VRSGLLKTTVLAAVAGTVWTQLPQVALRLRRLSLKCWFMGHDDWIRRTPDRLYLEYFECGRETQGWATGKGRPTDGVSDVVEHAPIAKRQGHCAPASVGSPMRSTKCERPRSQHDGDITLAA
jgi:hypothetical protein